MERNDRQQNLMKFHYGEKKSLEDTSRINLSFANICTKNLPFQTVK